MRHDDLFAGRETQVQKAVAILAGSFETVDAEPSIQGNVGEAPGGLAFFQMKTIIIFNYHKGNYA